MNKLKYWQKGAYIGGVIGVILAVINTFLLYGFLGIIFYPLNLFLESINFWGIKGCGESCWDKVIIIGNFELIIFSILIAIIIYILQNKKIKKK